MVFLEEVVESRHQPVVRVVSLGQPKLGSQTKNVAIYYRQHLKAPGYFDVHHCSFASFEGLR